jgi:CRP/FNR family transcriptional regulator, anaerobic regulatory protein
MAVTMTINPNHKLNQAAAAQNAAAELLDIFRSFGKPVAIKKGVCILKEGTKSDFLFLVESGGFRTYRWFNETEITIGFSFTGDIDTCPSAYFNNTASLDYIEALAESNVLKIYKGDFEKALRARPRTAQIEQILLCRYIDVLVNRLIENKALTAEVQYRQLRHRQPALIEQIPLKYIASYLGISKERLSRIRKKL